MTLRDVLKKKDKIEKDESHDSKSVLQDAQFTILRSDSNIQEVLNVPAEEPAGSAGAEKRRSLFRRKSASSQDSRSPGREQRLSTIFHRRGSHASRSQSPTLPDDLEHIEDGGGNDDDKQAKWEKRATVLAQGQPSLELPRARPGVARRISDAKSDDDIQKAIELHEAGALEMSTAMFGRLADPQGENNALSQVLYGMALRHGWGIPSDPERAVTFLSLAARNSAAVETAALQAGMKKGGAAKGELVLAIFELANCYMSGLGVGRDPVAARKYYETAAQLGDIDALEQAARCYEQGIGGKKDKFTAAKYYRMAEAKGLTIVGNSWIWKDKYDPQP